MTALRALALNCSLKAGGSESSTELLLDDALTLLKDHGVEVAGPVRIADHDVKPGVSADEGPGDEWPAIRRQIVDADILVLGTPIWMGQPSSVVKRVLERMDAFLGEADDQGHYPTTGKVAMVAVVGNEDGAHHVSAELFQALNDVGYSLAPNAVTYWVGEAMQSKDLKDLPQRPEKTAAATKAAVTATAHLAQALQQQPYPATK